MSRRTRSPGARSRRPLSMADTMQYAGQGMPPMPHDPGYFPPHAPHMPPPAGHYAYHPQHAHHPPPPAAPQAPNSGQQTPYSTHPHSPTSSSENLGHYPAYPSHHHSQGFVSPGAAPAPIQPDSKGSMRGGDLGRRNTTASRPAIHHYDTDYTDYRSQRPVIHTHASTGNASDISAPDRGGPFMVIPGTGGAVHRSSTYRPGSSQFSDGSYEGHDLRSQSQKGYIISSGSTHSRRRPQSTSYQVARAPSERERRNRTSMYQVEGPPRRREREQSEKPPSDDEYYEEAPRPSRRITTGTVPTMSGALVPQQRARSRSASEQDSHSGALVRRRSDEEITPPGAGTIRLEYGGQAIDITYNGGTGKPIVGNITINTTARTIEPPSQRSEPQPQKQQYQALPAPPAPGPPPPQDYPPQRQLALPSNIPVIQPPPPLMAYNPHGAAPAPGPPPSAAPPTHRTHSDYTTSEEADSPPLHARESIRQDLYHSMASLALDSAPAPGPPPPGPPTRQPMYHHQGEEPRGRHPRDMPPQHRSARSRSRRRSRSRPPPPPSESVDSSAPVWTKMSRDLVSKRAVMVKGYEFEDSGDKITIHRVLKEAEIDDLVELSQMIRRGEIEVVPVSRAELRRKESERESTRDRDGSGASERPRHRPDARDMERRRRRRSSSTSQGRRPMSIHSGYPDNSSGGGSGYGPPGGPGPSKERPPPLKPAIVSNRSGHAPPEAPPPPPVMEDSPPPPPPPPVTVQQTKGWGLSIPGGWGWGSSNDDKVEEKDDRRDGLKENMDLPGTYVGYTRTPKGR